jgi:hypothetical protein
MYTLSWVLFTPGRRTGGGTGVLMGRERRTGPVEALRNVALALERLAAREAASGAVRGAVEGLREELPELDEQLRTLLEDALTALGRLAHEAAEREHVQPGEAARRVAGAATQGALETLERAWREGDLPLHAFLERLNRLLDEVVEFAHTRADEIRMPQERAQAMARAMVKAAVEQLHVELTTVGRESKLLQDADALADLLEHAGRGLGRGLAAGIREELEGSLERVAERSAAAASRGALKSLGAELRPLLAAAGAGSALLVLSFLVVRWRGA